MLNWTTLKRWHCRRLQARLVDFAGGDIEPRDRRTVAAHLAGCPPCAARVRALREVPARLRSTAVTLAQDEHYWEQQRHNIMRAVRAAVPEKSGWPLPRPAPQWQLGLAAAALLFAVASYRLFLAPAAPPEIAREEQALDATTALALADWSDTLLAAIETGAESEWIPDEVVSDWTQSGPELIETPPALPDLQDLDENELDGLADLIGAYIS